MPAARIELAEGRRLMQAARARVVAAVAVVAVVVLCVAFGIRSRERTDDRGGPSTASRTPEGQPTGPRGSSGGLSESRRTPAPVGTGMAVTRLAFGSQDNGYALLPARRRVPASRGRPRYRHSPAA